jgi:tRNA(Ile)-lysidine synthase
LASTDIRSRFDDILDQRLMAGDPAPLAVAFSGGGDSLALLLYARDWAETRGRRLLALTVDHRLRPEGADWAHWCAARAARLDVAHATLVWDGAKPRSGLAAAARKARHGLLAAAARRAGARVIVMAHTADDAAEAALMRADGATTPGPRIWSPAPVWPEGREIFLLRPLLAERRAALRADLGARGETWIEDPANADPASARARARRAIAVGAKVAATGLAQPAAVRPLDDVLEGPAGDLTLARGLLTEPDRAAGLAAALTCVAGSDRAPRRAAVERLICRLAMGGGFTATLGGVRITARPDTVTLARETTDARSSEARRARLVAEGRSAIWDGRFLLPAPPPGTEVTHLDGRAARLTASLRTAVGDLAPEVRRALPVLTHADGSMDLPTLGAASGGKARSLVLTRLRAAFGLIADEQSLRVMA